MYVGEFLYDLGQELNGYLSTQGVSSATVDVGSLDGSSNTIDGLFQLLLKTVWSQRNILHSYLTNTRPERPYL